MMYQNFIAAFDTCKKNVQEIPILFIFGMLDFWNHCQLFMAQDEDFEYLFIYQWSTEWTLHTIFPVGLRFQHSNLRYHFDECDYGSLESATLTITKVRQLDFFKKNKKT